MAVRQARESWTRGSIGSDGGLIEVHCPDGLCTRGMRWSEQSSCVHEGCSHPQFLPAAWNGFPHVPVVRLTLPGAP